MISALNLWVLLIVFLIMFCKLHHSFLRKPTFGLVSKSYERKLSSVLPMAASYSASTTAKITVSAFDSMDYCGDLLVVPFYKAQNGVSKKDDKANLLAMRDCIPNMSSELKAIVSDVLGEEIFKAERASKQLIRVHGTSSGVKYVALVGLGMDPKKGKEGDLDVKAAARLGKVVAQLAKETMAESIGVVMPVGTGTAGVTPFLVAIQDTLYVDNRFKKVPEDGFPELKWKSLSLLGCSKALAQNIQLTDKLSAMISSGVQFAKDLVGKQHCSANIRHSIVLFEDPKRLFLTTRRTPLLQDSIGDCRSGAQDGCRPPNGGGSTRAGELGCIFLSICITLFVTLY